MKIISGFFILALVLITLLATLAYASYDILKTDYSSFIHSVYQINPDSYLIEEFPLYLTKERFSFLKFFLPILTAFSLLLLMITWKYKAIIDRYLVSIINDLKTILHYSFKQIKNLSDQEKIILIFVSIIILLSRVYLFERYPFNGDEFLSYFSFIRNGLFLTWTYYPTTNNHIFYNLICLPFSYFCQDPIWAMRLPNVLINILLLYTLFSYVLRRLNFSAAILCLIFSGLTFCCTIYAVHGRGYMLESLFTILSLISVIEITHGKPRIGYWFLFIVSSILGAFTIVLYILPLSGILLFGLLYSLISNQKFLFKKFILSIIIIAVGITLLYIPTILVSGWDSIFNNSNVSSHTNFFNYYNYYNHIVPVASVEGIDFVLGTTRKGYVFLLFYFLLLIITYRRFNAFEKTWVYFSIICIASTFLIFFIKRAFGEPRYFTFYGFLFFPLFSFIINHLIVSVSSKIKVFTYLIATMLFTSFIYFQFDAKMKTFYGNDYFKSYHDADKMIDYLSSKAPRNIYVVDKGMLGELQYYNAITSNAKIHLVSNGLEKRNSYDFIILNTEEEYPFEDRLSYKKIQASPGLICYERVKF